MIAKLKVLSGSHAGTQILISEKFLIGRSESCQLRPKSESVSRKHCIIIERDDWLIVQDLRSTTGTFVNGRRLPTDKAKVLHSGDHIRIGKLEFELMIDYENVEKIAEPTSEEFNDIDVEFLFNEIEQLQRIHKIEDDPSRDEPLDISAWLKEADQIEQVHVSEQVDSELEEGLGGERLIQGVEPEEDGVWLADLESVLASLTDWHVHYSGRSDECRQQLLDPLSKTRERLSERFDTVAVLDCKQGVKDGRFSLGHFLRFVVRDTLTEAVGVSFGDSYNQEQISQLLKDLEDRICLFCFLDSEYLSQDDLLHLREFTQSDHRVLFCGPNAGIQRKCRNRRTCSADEALDRLSRDAADDALKRFFSGR